jgi:hypothetical protein
VREIRMDDYYQCLAALSGTERQNAPPTAPKAALSGRAMQNLSDHW